LLAWGPIIWALIGTAAGFLIGLGLKLLFVRRKTEKLTKSRKEAGIVLIVACPDTQADMINTILWDNGATGTSKLSLEV
jgi:hypothetical protein